MTILRNSNIIAFIPSTNLDASKLFYQEKLGLHLDRFDDFALEFKADNTTLRVTKVNDFQPAAHTIFGWKVNNIELTIKELLKLKIEFEMFDHFTQSEFGVRTFPGGSKVAWFKDPDGNILSITEPHE